MTSPFLIQQSISQTNTNNLVVEDNRTNPSEKDNQKILDEWLDKLPESLRSKIKERLFKTINYEPKIGIMGKSGAGKSSLVNAILTKAICETGGVGGCTREIQEEKAVINGTKITFVDLPGVAENKDRHSEYDKLYAEKIKELDLILWVIKVDDRANKNDEEFYEELIQYYDKKRILFVLSQCDKAQPNREFDYPNFKLSQKQLDNISQNKKRISEYFNIPANYVLPVACEYYEEKFNNWNIPELITRIIEVVPSESKSAIYKTIPKENRTLEAKSSAKSGFRKFIEEAIDTVINHIPMPDIAKNIAKKAKDIFLDGIGKAWDYFFD
ncbi:50S ribosome-binding GTPase [Aggregatibacter actinomycetemcomitans]|uniref:GTPase family protein n=1 Tax=Aggregatibacter actinomycetemcomitans TaxID=714 RepID=UPI00197C4214|nr:GTPase [Aggregatibacter actinomycetemcomitans]MBN6068996.1 50S ribosome-binding GTPase [Aggregatibacter actinomycetemcomitans]MBN6087004.1 50S ribosome-binding GTPase [Aggregatibacter actinomycetemcomitans]